MSQGRGRFPPGRGYGPQRAKTNTTPPPQGGGGGPPGGGQEGVKRHHEQFQMLLQDMGLDFKSYQGLTRGDNTVKAVSNQFVIPGEDTLTCTEPTLGLLILVLHSAQHTVGPTCVQWLRLYRDVQAAIASGSISSGIVTEARLGIAAQNHTKIVDMAMNAVKCLDKEMPWDQPNALAALPRHVGQDFVRKLFMFLDEQSGLRGQNQSPSGRRVQSDPKGMLCNLFLTAASGKPGGGCQQGFLCNQIHISPARGWENRGVFFGNLASALSDRGVRAPEVCHRVKDAIFYAKYANKVSLKVHGGYIIFFKTSYSRGRLNHATGVGSMCPAKGNAALCMFGENCEGVHVGDAHGINAVKSTEPLDASVVEDLEKECQQCMTNARPAAYVVPERRRPAAEYPPRTATPTNPPVWGGWMGNAPKEIDPKLLDQLAGVSRSPIVGRNDGMTPVLDELYRHHGFESGEGFDSTGDSPQKLGGGPDTPIHVSGGPGGHQADHSSSMLPVKLNTGS